jgi:FkbM family methyltransferase
MSSTLLRPLALFFGYDLRTVRRSDSIDLHLKRFFSQHDVGLLVDVGAHHGEFGRQSRKMGYRGPIASFEPSAASFAELTARAAGDATWKVFHCALGDKKDRLDLNINAGSNFNSLLPSRPDMVDRFPGLRTDAVEKVDVERLDSVLDTLGIGAGVPIFLKSDTQGHDLAVLRGAGQRLAQVKGLLLEMSVRQINEGAPSHWDVASFVRAQGFEAYGFATVSRDASGGMIEYDALFKRDVLSV